MVRCAQLLIRGYQIYFDGFYMLEVQTMSPHGPAGSPAGATGDTQIPGHAAGPGAPVEPPG